MKLKRILTFCIMLALCVSVLCLGFVTDDVQAAGVKTIFSDGTAQNSSLATRTGSGLTATFGTASDEGYIKAINSIDLNKFALEFCGESKHFGKLFIEFTNVEDDEVGFVVLFEHVTENLVTSTKISVYDVVDYEGVTATAETTLNEVTLTTYNFWLEYVAGVLSIKTQPISQDGSQEYSAATTLAQYTDSLASKYANFAWIEDVISGWKPLKEANLRVGVVGQEDTSDDLGEDVVPQTSKIGLLSITSFYGTQVVGGELSVRPIIKTTLKDYRGYIIDENFADLDTLFNADFQFDMESENPVDVRAINVVGAKGANYYFPFYMIPLADESSDKDTEATQDYFDHYFADLTLYVKEYNGDTEGEWTLSTDVLSATSDYDTLDKAAGTKYAYVFEAKIDKDNDFKFAVVVDSVEDDILPEVNQANFLLWANSSEELQKIFLDSVIDAPETGSYIFPDITRAVNREFNIFSDKIGQKDDPTTQIDNENYNNFEIVVGYKKDGSTSGYVYGTSTSVSLKSVGEWTFAYKVTDQSGNEKIIYEFTKIVQDITPPTIKVSVTTKEIEIGDVLEVPVATRSDNCSGVNTDLNTYTVYYLNYELNSSKGYNLDNDGKIKFSELVKLEQVKIDEGFKITEEMRLTDDYGNAVSAFIVVYEATDKAGNKTIGETYGFVKAVSPKDSDKEKNPVNEVLEIILIVVVSLIFVSLLVLIFVNPTQKKRDARLEALAIANETKMNEMYAENQAKKEKEVKAQEDAQPAVQEPAVEPKETTETETPTEDPKAE